MKNQKLKNCITFIDHIDYTIWYMFIMNFYQKFYMYMKTGLLLLQRQLLHVVTKSDQKYININTCLKIIGGQCNIWKYDDFSTFCPFKIERIFWTPKILIISIIAYISLISSFGKGDILKDEIRLLCRKIVTKSLR